ncbi:MAG TPA: helix-turn-helix transcriptional regulator [Caulobacteraceae bacterium]|nr:helix-turn-helix transcriptional regulator [Caulobacteraceae bacterium]
MDGLVPAEASRAARALLKWSVQDLAAAAGVSASTVTQLEAGRTVRREVETKVFAALTREGVRIVSDEGVGAVLDRRDS